MYYLFNIIACGIKAKNSLALENPNYYRATFFPGIKFALYIF